MHTDNQLLESFVRERSESAFRKLVERRVNLVHSAALRESHGNPSLAEDITQAVFSELARRAASLVRHPALSGWLYTCVRRMAANVRRAEERRQRREREAFSMNAISGSDPTDTGTLWQDVRPALDDVMHELSEADRTAVVLRFFEGRNLKEVGLALGLTENAARMRVQRALEKLREQLSRRGVNSTAATLAAALAAGAVLSAPPALASTVTMGAVMSASASGLAGIFGWTTVKGFVLAGAAALMMTLIIRQHFYSKPVKPADLAETKGLVPSAIARFDSGPNNDPAVSASLAESMQMSLAVVDSETGEPLPGTKLYLFYLRQDGRGEVVRRMTDLSGRTEVDKIERPFHGLNMFVTARGHVPKVTSWGRRVMPAEYTMKMEPGVTVAGIVSNEQGEPVPGAKIEFDTSGNNMALAENIQFGPDTVTHTDGEGRWSCSMAPKDIDRLSLVVTHADYAEASAIIRPSSIEADDFKIVLKAGFSVTGVVRDENGQPIPGAKLRELSIHSETKRSRITEASGKFEFENTNPGALALVVQAEGFAPAFQALQVTGTVNDVEFMLGPGQTLRGRVVDEEGNPIQEAWVETTRGRNRIQWSDRTDLNGRFEWNSAPREPLPYSFQADGFKRGYALEFRADGSEHEIKLTREQPEMDMAEVSGTVVDAQTASPLDEFRVMIATFGNTSVWPLEFVTMGKDGKFLHSIPASREHDYQIQIEKEGYLPAISKTIGKNDGSQQLHFKLHKGSGPSGLVLLPNGEPASNATVLLCTPRAGFTMRTPAYVGREEDTTTYRTKTDANGKFSLPAAIDPQGLVVVHEQGYAELSPVETKSTVSLQAWGRVLGMLVLDSQPVANERIVIGRNSTRYTEEGHRFNFTSFHLETKTDAAGRFSFEKVPPGECAVFRQTLRDRGGFESHDTLIVVEPGSVTEVTIGGTGRTVFGNVVLSAAGRTVDWQEASVRLSPMPSPEPGVQPMRADFPSTEAYVAAAEAYFGTWRSRRRYGTLCDPSGTFRLSDVPAGTYQLEITLLDSELVTQRPTRTEIGSIIRQLIVSDVPEGESDIPIDLGTLVMAVQQEDTVASGLKRD